MARGFILVPLYLHYLGAEIYGIWLATGNILAWLGLVDPGVGGIFQQQAAKALGENNNKKIGHIIWTSLMLSMAIVAIVLLLGLAIVPWLGQILPVPSENLPQLKLAFSWMVLGNALMLASFATNGVLLGLHNTASAGIISTLGSLVNFTVIIIAFIHGFGLVSFGIGVCTHGIVANVGNLIILLSYKHKVRNVKITASYKYLKEIGKLFSFTSFSKISSTISRNLDKFVIAKFISPESAVMLGVTQKAMELSSTMLQRVGPAFLPSLSHLFGENKANKYNGIIKSLVYIHIALLIIIFGGYISLNERFVILWVGKEYFGGQTLTILFAASFSVLTINSAFSYFVMSMEKIKEAAKINFLDSFLRVVLLLIFISLGFGIYSPAIATILAGIFSSFLLLGRILVNELLITLNKTKNFTIVAIVSFGFTITYGLIIWELNSIKNWLSFSLYLFGYLSFAIALQLLFLVPVRKIVISYYVKLIRS